MKQFDLIYSPDDKEIFLFNNLDLNKLSDPLTIEREEIINEEEQVFDKKKSEVVEYEDEKYLNLREEEQNPFVITDSESRAMCGKFQDVSDGASMYFAFVNVGNTLNVVPISKWYRFVQKNQFSEGDVEGLEKNLNIADIEEGDSDSVHEIDYDEKFDDDDEDANEIYISKEKELSTSGKKIQGLVEYLEEEKDKKEKEEEEEEYDEDTKKAKTVIESVEKKLTNEDIRKVFKGRKISIKDLLISLKSSFKMDDIEKNLIREFIKENCVSEVDGITGEKVFRLKK